MKPQPYKNIIILFSIIIVSIFLYKSTPEFFSHTSQKALLPNKESSAQNLQTEREYWKNLIQKIGAERGYAEFIKKYKKIDFKKQHTLAHIVGALLYEKAGISGLAICDQSFAFGCYHGFFSQSVSTDGLEIIPALDAICIAKYGPLGTGCQHGIGHGILEYMGPQKFVDALESCKLTTQIKELFGCTSGLFMEYNTPTIFTDSEVFSKDREFNPANPYEPCNTVVPAHYRNSCYFEISLWWKNVLAKDYKKIGQLCQAVENEKNQESCFLGFGTVAAPNAEYDVAETIRICNMMPTDSGRLLCRAGASWSFWAFPEKRNQSAALCQGFENVAEGMKCLNRSDLIGNGEKKI